MDVVHERCAGLDVHKKTVVACVLRPAPKGVIDKEVRTFGTMTADLEALRDWLAECGCSHVAMEATGVYWKPVYNVLEQADELTLLVINAQHLKTVPAAKPTLRMPSGLPICSAMGCCAPASFLIATSVSCASWCAIGPH